MYAMAGRRNVATTTAGGNDKSSTKNEPTRRTGRRVSSRTSSNTFNPKLIFSQIVAIQCFHYLILGLMVQINHFVFATSVTIDRIFTDEYLTVWTPMGWIDSFAILFSYLFG
mmetsp:Transcript_9898/g.16441  ORF Transcript_9898/g.16441 Transcript_9898/m.16441 type:complete len:112 (-) Transcript_9898:1019-1354(-)